MADAFGGLVIVFCRSGSTEFVGAHVTGRAAADAVGMLRPSTPIQVGLANYTSIQRWGDYSGTGLDPGDPSIVWAYTEFADATGNWSTAIGAVRI